MRLRRGGWTLLGAAMLAIGLAPAAALDSRAGAENASGWIDSPYRHFGPPRTIASGRAVLFDEADDPELSASVGAELTRLETELFRRQGWRSPFAGTDPLRVYVARSAGDGMRSVAAASVEKGLLREPAVLLDASGLDGRSIVREVSRRIALAVLEGYGVEDPFLGPALAEYLSAPPADSGAEAVWSLAAAGSLDFRAEPATLGRLWVDEVARDGGGTAMLRDAWQRAAETGEAPTAVVLRAAAQQGQLSEGAVLLRASARLYAAIEPEASPSRLRLLDVVSGGIDAAPPAALAVRHRVLVPETDQTLRVSWPPDGGAGAAVVRYADPLLPPDVVTFAAGESRSVPLSGVARVDVLVAGDALGGRGIAAPADAELVDGVPFAGLEGRAAAEGGPPRLIWTTASHEGMWGWAIFREQVLPDGRVVRRGPEILPSAERAAQSYRYEFVDSTAQPGIWYRYTVWAVSDGGVLARAFSTTVRAPD